MTKTTTTPTATTTREATPGSDRASVPVSLVVCEGCCCGRRGVDTDRLRRLGESRPDVVDVRTSGCLGRCDYGDVVVVRPSRAGREHGARPVWLGFVDDEALDAVERWVFDGGPGLASMPESLAIQAISPPRGGSAAR